MIKRVSQFDEIILTKIRKNVSELLKSLAHEYDKEDIKILDIAPQDYLGAKEFFNKAKIYTLDIDEKSNADYVADLCACNKEIITDQTFDIVICTEVLEHTLNPFNAVNEIYRILKLDGKAAITTPYNFRIHGPLPDCWRFTEHGLRELFKKFKSTVITEYETIDRFLMPYQYAVIAIK